MNIYEVKELTREKSPYFFSSDTLKFFGQTMQSFKVKQSPEGKVFIYAKSKDFDGRMMGYTFREYKDGDLISVPGNTLDEIERHIKLN